MLGIFGPTIKKCEKIFSSDPTNIENALILIELYLKENRVSDAISIYEKICKDPEIDNNIIRKLGDLYFRSNQVEKLNKLYMKMYDLNNQTLKYIIKDYEVGIKKVKKNKKNKALRGIADILRTSGMLQQAVQYYAQIASKERQDIEIREHMAEIYVELSRYKEAAVTYNELIKIRPEESSYYMNIAELYSKMQRYVQMRDSYEKVLHFYPDKIDEIISKIEFLNENKEKNEEVIISLAKFYQLKKDVDKALLYYNEILEKNPENLMICEKLLDLFIDSQKYDKAAKTIEKYFNDNESRIVIQYYNRILEKNPKHLNSLVAIYNIYKNDGMINEASKILEKMKTDGIKSVVVYTEMANAALDKGLVDEAIDELSNALELEPDNIVILEELGLLYLQKDDNEKVKEIYLRILNIEPSNLLALKELGYIFLQENNFNNSYKYFMKYLRIEPDDIYILRDVSFLLIENKKYNEAKNILKHIIKIDPKNVDAYKELASIFIIDKKYNYAEDLYNKILLIENDIEHQITLTKIYISSKQFKRAVIEFKQILKKNNNYEEVLEIYENTIKDNVKDNNIFFIVVAAEKIYEKLNKNNEYIKTLLFVLKYHSTNIYLLSSLFECYIQENDKDNAHKIAKAILKIKPDDIKSIINYAYIIYLCGEKDKARQIYEQKIKDIKITDDILIERINIVQRSYYLDEVSKYKKIILDADENEKNKIYYKIAELYYKSEEYDEAITNFQKIKDKDISFKPNVYYLNGLCFFKKGLKDIALKNFLYISKLSCNDDLKKELLYKSGRVLERNRSYSLASKLYKELLSMDLNYKDVNKRLKRLSDDNNLSDFGSSSGSMQDRYEDLVELGKGGMGMVYKAKDKKLGRTIAIKVLKKELSESKKALKRFIREAQASAILNHPNIVAVYDVEELEQVFITMEYVEGRSLMDIIDEESKVSIEKTIAYGIQICNGLHYAHEKKIVHRDIKPDNVMITKAGVAKIADFGLAKIEAGGNVTKVGTIMGTPYYMSPEQAKGLQTDRRTDIYAFGITLYHMLCGQVPFNKGQVVYHHIHTKPEPLININPDVPQILNDIVMKCIEKNVDDRYQTCKEVENDLKNLN